MVNTLERLYIKVKRFMMKKRRMNNMSEVVRETKKIERKVVKLEIEMDEEWFEMMDKAKKQVAEQRGYDVSYGAYIQEAMDDMVHMIEELSKAVAAQQYQDGMPHVVEREPEPGEVVPDEPAEPAPEDMYAKTDEPDVMFQ
jgi:hypothetical protein